MHSVTALFFDLDGTLVDTLPDIARAVNRLRRENGRSPLSREQVQVIVGDGARKLVLRAMGGERETWFQRFMELYDRDLLCDSCLYDGIETVLDFYEDKMLACITNKPTINKPPTSRSCRIISAQSAKIPGLASPPPATSMGFRTEAAAGRIARSLS